MGRRLWLAHATGVAGLLLLTAACSPDTASPAAHAATTTTSAAAGSTSVDPTRWRQAWSDEFNGSTLNRSSWQVEHRSTFGDGNLEQACLMDRPQNVSVSGGQLHLTARHDTPPLVCKEDDPRFPGGRDYSSAMISTRGLRSWTGGRFEIRARLPTSPGASQGLWPAFWLRPVDGADGEIDIMEALGSSDPASPANEVHQTFWSDTDNVPKQSAAAVLPTGRTDTEYHVYGLQWEADSLSFSIDGQVTFTRTRAQVPWLTQQFSRPFFLRLNLAVGGRWPGPPDSGTRLPASLDVDYVRTYLGVG